MTQTYAFLFCLALGVAARFVFMLVSALAKRTDLLPITIILDFLTVAAVGGAFAAYTVFTATVLAPYMFAALAAGYLFTYHITKNVGGSRKPQKKKHRASRRAKSE